MQPNSCKAQTLRVSQDFDQMNLIFKIMDESACCPTLWWSRPESAFLWKVKKFCYASHTLLFLGFYAIIFVASVFFQHSTNEVKKLGAETSSIRFQVDQAMDSHR